MFFASNSLAVASSSTGFASLLLSAPSAGLVSGSDEYHLDEAACRDIGVKETGVGWN